MPSMDCPNCDGTGYTQDASGEDVVCPMCDGTGVLVSDEGDADVQQESELLARTGLTTDPA